MSADASRRIAGRFEASTRYADLAQVDAVIVAVPTPLTQNREPDLQPLIAAGTALAGVLQEGQLVVLESTTYPGTTRERLVPMLEESGLAAERDFFVAFSPERIDPGRTDHTLRTTPKVVGAVTPESLERAVRALRAGLRRRGPVSTPEAAELSKLLENVFRSVNIALVNELAILCDRMGVDIWEVVEAAATKPYGFMSFKPGPGMGGHCLPVDPFYLAWRAREFDQPTEFIELAGEVNQRMPYFCVEKIGRALNDHSRPINGSRIAVVGVSYKAGVGDLRESPGAQDHPPAARPGRRRGLQRRLRARAARLRPRLGAARQAARGRRLRVIVTAHPGLDVERIVASGAAGRGLPRRHPRDRGFQPRASLTVSLRPSDRAPGLLLGDGVELPDDVELGANVVVHAGTRGRARGRGCTTPASWASRSRSGGTRARRARSRHPP